MKTGVAHADELIYLYKFPFKSIPPGLNATEQVLSNKMGHVWTNFVIHGYNLSNLFILFNKFNITT